MLASSLVAFGIDLFALCSAPRPDFNGLNIDSGRLLQSPVSIRTHSVQSPLRSVLYRLYTRLDLWISYSHITSRVVRNKVKVCVRLE